MNVNDIYCVALDPSSAPFARLAVDRYFSEIIAAIHALDIV